MAGTRALFLLILAALPLRGAAVAEQTICGRLVQGVECVLFESDSAVPSGGLYLLSDTGGFHVGDAVCVTGAERPDCVTICMQGNGCFDVTKIEAAPRPTPTPTPSPSSTPPSACIGDCNGDGVVTVDELVRGVNIALGTLPFNACSAFDCSTDCGPGPARPTPSVTVTCLIRGVANTMKGCPPVPCSTDEDCDNGNDCTMDRCVDGSCVHDCLCV